MPFVLPALGDLAFAVLFLLLAASVHTLQRMVKDIVPDVKVFGVHLFGWLYDALDSWATWVDNMTESVISRLEHVFVDIGHGIATLAHSIVQAVDHTQKQTSHVANTVVPRAASDAVQSANQYTDSATQVLGGELSRARADLAQAETSLQNNINTLQDVTLPDAIGQARSDLGSRISQVQSSLQDNINALTDTMTQDLANVMPAIAALQSAVGSTIPAELQSQQSALAAQIQSLSGQLQSIQAQAAAAAAAVATADATARAADLSTAEGVAASEAAQAASKVAATDATALSTAATALQAQIDQLRTVQTITVPQLPNVAIPTAIPVPLAVGALATAVAGIVTEIDRCMVTTCDGPNNWQNLVNGIFGAINMGELLALIAAGINDPNGEGAALASVGQDVYTAGHALLDQLLSL